MESGTPAQLELLKTLGILPWKLQETVKLAPLNPIVLTPEPQTEPKLKPEQASVPVCTIIYDTIELLRDCHNAKVIWILSETEAFSKMSAAAKQVLRSLMQCTGYTLPDIVPATVGQSDPEITTSAAHDMLEEQCGDLGVSVILTHVPLPIQCCLLPTAAELLNNPDARAVAHASLKHAGLLF